MKDSTGRKVIDVEFEPSDESSFVVAAYYDDDGTPVPEDELDYLTDAYPEACSEAAFEAALCAAESMGEGDR